MASEFARIDFHDWRLFDFSVRTIAVGGGRFDNEVRFRIRSDERSPPTPPREVEVTFQKARGLRAVLDLWSKTACYDSITENFEYPKDKNPELLRLMDASERDHLYVLVLTEPGGTIEVVAEGVTVQELTPGT
jgi:hypothetical protein